MWNQKLKSDSVPGLRYPGLSPGLPSASRFRSGHMPSGMTAARVAHNLSESDMDVSSESERDYSLEASPQDDKLPNGSSYTSVSGFGSFLERRGVRFADDDDESVSSSEANSTPPRSINSSLLEKKFKFGSNFSGINLQSNIETAQTVSTSNI